jgi:hypothetical protein
MKAIKALYLHWEKPSHKQYKYPLYFQFFLEEPNSFRKPPEESAAIQLFAHFTKTSIVPKSAQHFHQSTNNEPKLLKLYFVIVMQVV